MKVMTVFGSRPEIIKLSLILKVLDQHSEHIVVQIVANAEREMCDDLIRDLEIRQPDYQLVTDTYANGSQQISSQLKDIVAEHKPDRILVIGGSTAALAGCFVSGKETPVFHLEAGIRCFDENFEEDNRISVDHTSSILLTYTSRSMSNLIREGIEAKKIFVTGNPVKEVHDSYADQIESSGVMKGLNVKPFDYFLATLHRAYNIDSMERVERVFDGFAAVAAKFDKTVLIAAHPRTAEKLKLHGVRPTTPSIRLLKALSFFDFAKLSKNSLAVLTDSSTVQDECSIFGIPNVTLSNMTDRPETIDCGSNMLSGVEPDAIVRAVELAISQPAAWTAPAEYLTSNVSQTVSKIVLGQISS
ncbi:MAG TPA: UDP-N-acetylglucosamine 2-epimerase (non-hydrolyzing) [Pyrinomonadaceae bacterium]|nr:UDP-N-acetylglucosamine 2-epimerase (non-hydrolyzing) [Pyrinomonadaceae bacterium]